MILNRLLKSYIFEVKSLLCQKKQQTIIKRLKIKHLLYSSKTIFLEY
jgi:hypothetical protein